MSNRLSGTFQTVRYRQTSPLLRQCTPVTRAAPYALRTDGGTLEQAQYGSRASIWPVWRWRARCSPAGRRTLRAKRRAQTQVSSTRLWLSADAHLQARDVSFKYEFANWKFPLIVILNGFFSSSQRKFYSLAEQWHSRFPEHVRCLSLVLPFYTSKQPLERVLCTNKQLRHEPFKIN